MGNAPQRGRADYLALGDWNVVCYQCGRKRKASYMKRHWQGYYVCPEHWEERQPQDFTRGVPDDQTPPWVQPMPANYFIPISYLETFTDTISVNDQLVKLIQLQFQFLIPGSGATNRAATNVLATNGNVKINGPTTDMTLLETVELTKGRLLADSYGLSEGITFDITHGIAEGILLSGSLQINDTEVLADSSSFEETLSVSTSTQIGSETYELTEGFVATLTRPTVPQTNGSPTNVATTD